MDKRLPFSERLVYVGSCILTLGAVWLLKIIIKAALIESENVKN